MEVPKAIFRDCVNFFHSRRPRQGEAQDSTEQDGQNTIDTMGQLRR